MDAHRASLSTQVLYGSGSISVGIKNNLLGTYLLIYYNQVLGLDAGVAALAMAIALAVDAVSDPLVGIWSDRARTRWGRRHPFMYAALVPFAASYYLLLSDPGQISDQALFLRLLVLLVILRLSMTFYEVPRGALAPELSKDYDQRNALSAWAMAFGWLGGAGIAFVANRYLLDSFVDLEGYQSLAFWGGLGIFIGGFIVFLAITGMPWSGVWGAQVNEWANGNNFGYPAGVRVDVPMSNAYLSDQVSTSWSLEQAQVPESTPPDMATTTRVSAGGLANPSEFSGVAVSRDMERSGQIG